MLLDWEKTFEQVDHKCLCDALERMGIDAKVISVLKDGYEKATFFVEDEFGKSDKKKQFSGIRKGCPQSPYLFVIVMTCIERDIAAATSNRVNTGRVAGANFDMVFYADDTIVVSKTQEACEEMLELIENISGEYGLKLNKDKCVNLNINTDEQQTFKNGDKLIKAEEAVYLGNTLNSKTNATAEIDRQIQQVNITLWKLDACWRATEASKKWQRTNCSMEWKQCNLPRL